MVIHYGIIMLEGAAKVRTLFLISIWPALGLCPARVKCEVRAYLASTVASLGRSFSASQAFSGGGYRAHRGCRWW